MVSSTSFSPPTVAKNIKQYTHKDTKTYCLYELKVETQTSFKSFMWGFPGGTVVKNLPANAGDTGSCPGLGRSHMPRNG